MPAPGRFWQFSLQTYARPEIAEACLRLQDSRNVDVNLLLHALWCGVLGHRITLEERQELDAAVEDWHREVVRSLRHVRRWLKHQDSLPQAQAQQLREAIKQQELESERIEQEVLEQRVGPAEGAGGPAHAAVNLLAVVPRPDKKERSALLALLRSTWPGQEPGAIDKLLPGGGKRS